MCIRTRSRTFLSVAEVALFHGKNIRVLTVCTQASRNVASINIKCRNGRKKIEKEKKVLIYLIDHIKELACVLVGSVDYDV